MPQNAQVSHSAQGSGSVGGAVKRLNQYNSTTRRIVMEVEENKQHHILENKLHKSGHEWSVLFGGRKPTYEDIQPYLAEVVENGTVFSGKGGRTITKYTVLGNSHSVWVRLFPVNGTLKISTAWIN